MGEPATDQERNRQDKKPVSCPAMKRCRICDERVINDIEWPRGAGLADSKRHHQQNRDKRELDDCRTAAMRPNTRTKPRREAVSA